jgi:hypothetical protein
LEKGLEGGEGEEVIFMRIRAIPYHLDLLQKESYFVDWTKYRS